MTANKGSLHSLDAVTRAFAHKLRRAFTDEIARNPRDFKKQVIRLVRRELPPKRGRPPSPQIEAALAMVRQGRSVPEVLRVQVTGFHHLDAYGRYLAAKALRQALARRGWQASKNRRSRGTQPPHQSASLRARQPT